MKPHRRHGFGRSQESARTRVLSKEELKLVLLSLVGDHQRHGYELIREIKALSRGVYAPSSGMVYPALAELEDAGHAVHQEVDNGRKSYAVTETGAAEAAVKGPQIAELRRRIETLPQQVASEPPGIARALANLDMVLRHALDGSDLERVDEVIELLDETARRIERLGR